MKNIAFLGLGIMGSEMARHLKNAGHNISVWNRSYAKCERFIAKHGGFASIDLKEVVHNADYIMMCLGDDKSLEEIVLSEAGIINFVKKGAVIIDHTTVSAEISKRIFKECKTKGIDFIDAPVTGGQGGAINGTLSIMCGGNEDVFNKIKPIMSAYGANIEYFGEAGSGQICKMVNQICIPGIIRSLAEAVAFAEKSGIDSAKLFKTIGSGAGSSWQMNNRTDWMLEKNYSENKGFPVEWMVKDLNICIEEAERIGIDLKITKEINQMFKEVKEEINPRIDTSSLILLIAKN